MCAGMAKFKRKLFSPIPIHEVMAMENPLYLMARKAKKS